MGRTWTERMKLPLMAAGEVDVAGTNNQALLAFDGFYRFVPPIFVKEKEITLEGADIDAGITLEVGDAVVGANYREVESVNGAVSVGIAGNVAKYISVNAGGNVANHQRSILKVAVKEDIRITSLATGKIAVSFWGFTGAAIPTISPLPSGTRLAHTMQVEQFTSGWGYGTEAELREGRVIGGLAPSNITLRSGRVLEIEALVWRRYNRGLWISFDSSPVFEFLGLEVRKGSAITRLQIAQARGVPNGWIWEDIPNPLGTSGQATITTVVRS